MSIHYKTDIQVAKLEIQLSIILSQGFQIQMTHFGFRSKIRLKNKLSQLSHFKWDSVVLLCRFVVWFELRILTYIILPVFERKILIKEQCCTLDLSYFEEKNIIRQPDL